MNRNSLGVVLSRGSLAAAERSEGSPGEPQRSGVAVKTGADSLLASRPDSEVVAKPKRRTCTAEYKLGILQEAEAAAATRGGIGSLLRREGLYSSLLATWRRERANGILEALTPQKRGPKSKRHPLEEENQKLRRQNTRLAEDLSHPTIITAPGCQFPNLLDAFMLSQNQLFLADANWPNQARQCNEVREPLA